MSTFDELKNAVHELRKDYGDFSKLDLSDVPSEKTGDYQKFTMEEAADLFEEQLQAIESAMEDEARCLRYVSEDDMSSVRDLLALIKQYIDGEDYHNFTTNIDNLISSVRSFAMLSMEKMDSKRYSEVKNLEVILSKLDSIVKAERAAVNRNNRIKGIYSDVNLKLKTLKENIDENQQKSDALDQLQGNSESRHQEIQNMYNDIQSNKATFDEFLELIRKQNEDIAAQKGKIEHYEKQLETCKEEHTEMISTHNTEREKLLGKSRELIDETIGKYNAERDELFEKISKLIDETVSKHNIEREKLLGKSRKLIDETIGKHNTERDELFKKSHKLIDEMIIKYKAEQDELLKESRDTVSAAKNALEIGSAAGLGKYFGQKEEKMSDVWTKRYWISLILAASVSAIALGWYTSHTAKEGLEFVTLTRTFLMLIAMSVAGFAARQYSKNKSIELDYGYKSALAGSYLGLAEAFQEADKELRAKYAIKFMEEVLQDPQRNRNKKDSMSRSSTETVETVKEEESQKQAEPPVPKSNE